jgi:hypothetical protein
MTATELVARSLDSLTGALTPEVAQRWVDSEPPAEVLAKMEEFGSKASAGTLTAEEEQEYKSLIDLGDMIALLKLKARRILANGS